MIYKGYKYRQTKKVLMLPKQLWHGEQKNYVTFGRICKSTEPGAVKTDYIFRDELPKQYWPGDEQPPIDALMEATPTWFPAWFAWVKPIEYQGHSLTNLMYGKDGKAYLVYDGNVYVRSMKVKK